MAPPAAPSSNLKLTIGDIERKVDMSLDDIIKQSKEMGRKHRSKVKNRNRMISVPQMQSPQMEQPQVQQRGHVQHRREVQQRKDVLQRFVALRSSAIRQGKLEESRARNGSYVFVATKAAARQALSSNANVPLNQWSRYLQKPTISLGSGFVLGRGLSSRTFNGLIFRKPLQGTICPDGVAARNPKILGPHHLSKTGARRRPAVWWTAPLGKGVLAEPRRQTWGSNRMLANGSGRKPQTLDSRFASLREERQLQSQFGPHAVWRR